MVRERVIVALDVDTEARARAIMAALGDAAHAYKIGLQLLTAAGPGLMRELAAAGKCVFLDLKLFEIPTSVAGAVRAAAVQGATMVTVHASAGAVILRAAVKAARPWPTLMVLALTVVTRPCDADLREVGIGAGIEANPAPAAARRSGGLSRCGRIPARGRPAARPAGPADAARHTGHSYGFVFQSTRNHRSP